MMKMKYADENSFNEVNVFGRGEFNKEYAQYFIGNSYLNPLSLAGEPKIFVSNVTFEPGCRNNWHIHHASKGGGQLLICTAGEGWYQEWGKEPVELKPGTVITIPAEVKHWHGAKKDSWFAHIAMNIPGENGTNEWLEEVTDEQYGKLE
jgi:quercetin dioxygenase-like cupin family protein